MVWVVPLSGRELTPAPPSPKVYNARTFGVGQETEEFLPLNPQSVSLQSQLSRLRLDYDQLRQEPAIADLDWLFTPRLRLEERLSAEPLQASTPFDGGFTLPKPSSTGFGSDSRDLRHFHTSLLASCELLVSLWMLPLRNYPRHIN